MAGEQTPPAPETPETPPEMPRPPETPPPGAAGVPGAEPPPPARPPRTPPSAYLPPPPPRRPPLLSPIEPAATPGGARRWWWVAALAAAAVIAVLVVVLVLRPGSGPLVVGTDVSLGATQESGAGCTTVVHLTATGSLSGSGTLVYRFERSDGQSTADTQLPVDGNSGFAITEDWRFVGVHQGGGTMIFHIVSPTTREVRQEVSVSCP
jgi:hypothetical protein